MTVRLTEPSVRTHGVLSEPSLRTHCGKGREVEGKWKGSGREVLLTTRVETSHHGVQEGDVAGPPDEMMPSAERSRRHRARRNIESGWWVAI